MVLKVNGETMEFPATQDMGLLDLLYALELDPAIPGIAVAINMEVVPKSTWDSTRLHEGDQVEIIHARQGG